MIFPMEEKPAFIQKGAEHCSIHVPASAVRTGLHCAPVAHKTLGTFPAGTVRFSVGYFTSEEDFYELEKALGFIEENS